MSSRKRRTAIGGQFSARLIEMLRSPAYRALTLSGRRVLDRLEIELASHGGTMNGKLPVTYGDFQRYGIDRQAIAPAIREVVALGFAEVTERGRPSESDFGRHPNLFRITYCPTDRLDRTHEWRAHQTVESALAVAAVARKSKDEKAVAIAKVRSSRKTDAGVEKPHDRV